jgi:hypothetical protein
LPRNKMKIDEIRIRITSEESQNERRMRMSEDE